jgi:hypothetical protein
VTPAGRAARKNNLPMKNNLPVELPASRRVTVSSVSSGVFEGLPAYHQLR